MPGGSWSSPSFCSPSPPRWPSASSTRSSRSTSAIPIRRACGPSWRSSGPRAALRRPRSPCSSPRSRRRTPGPAPDRGDRTTLRGIPGIARVSSSRSDSRLRSDDGTTELVLGYLEPGAGRVQAGEAVDGAFAESSTVTAGGTAVAAFQVGERSEDDARTIELYAAPILLPAPAGGLPDARRGDAAAGGRGVLDRLHAGRSAADHAGAADRSVLASGRDRTRRRPGDRLQPLRPLQIPGGARPRPRLRARPSRHPRAPPAGRLPSAR